MLDKVYDPASIDKKWSRIWAEKDVFHAGGRSGKPSYSIILPPPNVTGKLTVGHALGTTVQDILIRWKRLRGFDALWLSGTDHAGIATQNVVEKALRERGIERSDLGREKFLEECWKWKEQYHGRIVEQLERLGASLDWSREAFTLDPGVSRAVRKVFVSLYEEGAIYRGRYIVNWCPSCQTAISDEEVDFREEDSKLYYIRYPFTDRQGGVTVGTTRPETMLGDVAVAMSPEDPRAGEFKGLTVRLPLTDRDIPIIFDEAVDPQFGTGFLKVTPSHDSTDFEIGLRHRLDPVTVIDRQGKMNDDAGAFAGMDILTARKAVLSELEKNGFLEKIDDYRHSVGHHDRCGVVIEPYISRQWFLKMEQLAAPAISAVVDGEIGFFPVRWKNIYLSWMENIRDWCISRQLWWGHRIPVWYCGDCNAEIVSMDDPTECTLCGSSVLSQDEDVLDTWFSSWLWTFSPMGWPDETKDLERFHPTDVLVTGGDIIFFWVARMIMASLKFRKEIPFSSVYITGIVRDAKGRKMSKSLGNSPDPIDIIENNGADAFRFSLMMLSPPGQDIMFDEKKVEVGRHFANKIWNATRFVTGQGGSDLDLFGGRVDPDQDDPVIDLFGALYGREPAGEIRFGWEDRWILSRLATRFGEFEKNLDSFRFDEAVKTIYDFFWHEFCDWYLELSKPAFREGGERSAGAAVAVRAVLGVSMVMLHPVMPFISEEIWSMLSEDPPLLAGYHFQGIDGRLVDTGLEEDVIVFREIVTSIRNLRQSFNIPHQQEVKVIINCEQGKSLPEKLSRFSSQIALMTTAGSLHIAEGAEKPGASAAAGHASIEIYLPLEGIIDIEAEKARIEKELGKLAIECDKIGARLSGGGFAKKAPAEVVEREKTRFEEMSDKRSRLERILEDLR
ncbi:MAG: valine--tRNA ligase [Candidatus Krumholzibacteriota bacterium]|nr:valine--tRNA ligase [Candidatus Krumholzibacteriota bacterium]